MNLTPLERKTLNYIRAYPDWVAQIENISTVRAIAYDSDKVQTSPDDTMLELAIRIEDFQERIEKVEQCLLEVFGTDERIKQMRAAFCYGKRPKMRIKTFCAMRKAFAVRLVEIFDFDETEEET